jgi:DNA-binding CsgD family transcriptional regulator
MSKFFNPDSLQDLILQEQRTIYPKPTSDTRFMKDDYINEFSRNENAVKIVFDHINFKILHISDNIEAHTGYPTQKFYKFNMLFVLGFFTFDHFNFVYVWLKWAIAVYLKLGHLHNSKQFICGVKMKHADGHIMRLMFRYSALEMTENGVVKIAAISVDDITHLIKGDAYWGRLERRDESNKMINVHHFHSTEKVDVPSDIISEREKEVLRLIALGKESKDIGEILFMSSHTADNHRRNMIAKTGARDTTALVQICRTAGVI